MNTPPRDLRALGPCALVLLMAACAAMAALQSSGGTGSATPPASAGASGAATPPAAPPVPKPKALADGSYRDLLGNKLVPPPVMLGGKLEPVHGAIKKHLGIDPAGACMITEVIPGLPAANAGLEPHDIIIAVEGLANANEKTIREHLRSMQPGDRMKVTYRRGNETGQATITVAAWHPDHMIRPLRPEHFTPLPALESQAPASVAQVQALEQRVAALEKEVAQMREAMKAGH